MFGLIGIAIKKISQKMTDSQKLGLKACVFSTRKSDHRFVSTTPDLDTGRRTRGRSVSASLQTTFGIGHQLARVICAEIGVHPDTPLGQVSRFYLQKLSEQIHRDFFINVELKRLILRDTQKFIAIGCYRGLRHHTNLPCRGQRTHTNARTVKHHRASTSLKLNS